MLGFALLGCDSEPRGEVDVLFTDAWVLAEPGETPWLADGVGEPCLKSAFGDEGAFFEVETDACPWGTWSQTLARPVRGGRLQFEFHHLDLRAPTPATAYVELGIGSATLWTFEAAIPGEGARFDIDVPVPDQDLGDVAWLHVHNHGDNSYRLGAVTHVP